MPKTKNNPEKNKEAKLSLEQVENKIDKIDSKLALLEKKEKLTIQEIKDLVEIQLNLSVLYKQNAIKYNTRLQEKIQQIEQRLDAIFKQVADNYFSKDADKISEELTELQKIAEQLK